MVPESATTNDPQKARWHQVEVRASSRRSQHVAILGDRRNYVSALVVPSFPVLEQHASEKGIPFASREELVTRPEIIAL